MITRQSQVVREFLQRHEAHCRECGYNLHGLEASRCPECGWVVELRLAVLDSPGGLGVMSNLSDGLVALILMLGGVAVLVIAVRIVRELMDGRLIDVNCLLGC